MTAAGVRAAGPGGTGVFGGTFNPIHVGHLRACEEVVEALGLERMIFVPSAEPPHKRGDASDAIAPARERLAWVRDAISGNPRFGVDALEVERGGRSYTVDTLRTLGERLAPARPIFVIGCDAFLEMDTWREPAEIFRLAHVAVTTRPPVASGSLTDWLPKCVRDEIEVATDGLSGRHRGADTWLRIVEIDSLEVSASEVRARLRAGRSVRYLLPENIRERVERSASYSGSRAPGGRA